VLIQHLGVARLAPEIKPSGVFQPAILCGDVRVLRCLFAHFREHMDFDSDYLGGSYALALLSGNVEALRYTDAQFPNMATGSR
jgi:hypothetical protein